MSQEMDFGGTERLLLFTWYYLNFWTTQHLDRQHGEALVQLTEKLTFNFVSGFKCFCSSYSCCLGAAGWAVVLCSFHSTN